MFKKISVLIEKKVLKSIKSFILFPTYSEIKIRWFGADIWGRQNFINNDVCLYTHYCLLIKSQTDKFLKSYIKSCDFVIIYVPRYF